MTSKSEWLASLKPGDTVTRMLAGIVPIHMQITLIDDLIHCGLWTFSLRNGAEIDEGLPSSESLCASYIIPYDQSLKAKQ